MKILVADKNRTVLKQVKRHIIWSYGIPPENITCCSDGRVVLEMINDDNYDLLVTELDNLENTTGYKVLFSLQLEKKFDNLKIIVISANDQAETVSAVQAIVMNRRIDYVLKNSGFLVNLTYRLDRNIDHCTGRQDYTANQSVRQCLDMIQEEMKPDERAAYIIERFHSLSTKEKSFILSTVAGALPADAGTIFSRLIKSNINETGTDIKESLIKGMDHDLQEDAEQSEKTYTMLSSMLAVERSYGETSSACIEKIQKCMVSVLTGYREKMALEMLGNILFIPFNKTLTAGAREFLVKELINIYRKSSSDGSDAKLQHTIESLFIEALSGDGMVEDGIKLVIIEDFTTYARKSSALAVCLKRLQKNVMANSPLARSVAGAVKAMGAAE